VLGHNLSNVIRQVGKQTDKNSSLGNFFRFQYLAFGNHLVFLNTIFGFGSTKTIL